jgi:hypothetical protein
MFDDDFTLIGQPVPERKEPEQLESWQRFLDEKCPAPEPRS